VKPPRPVEIIGGGLAGLSLGIALRHRGLPVTIREAGHYPRHRVCGEFITALDEDTKQALHLAGPRFDCSFPIPPSASAVTGSMPLWPPSSPGSAANSSPETAPTQPRGPDAC
jgi:2-polyprenyl-6-methoxyphenol hydroxylase-like FAD-dependent oxidoreductase